MGVVLAGRLGSAGACGRLPGGVVGCEVPQQPCYDAPFLDKVARIDLGAPPQVPGTQATFITGQANRFHPDDPSRGVSTRLQQVRTGDSLYVVVGTLRSSNPS